jgi:methionyl-tRNA synthetase
MSNVSLDDFKKIEITVGEILEAEKVPETDKLLKLKVNFNEANPRQIISGIAGYFPNEKDLVGKKYMFVANLESRIIKGFESQGMILAISTEDGKFSLLEPNDEIPAGTRAK